MKLYSLTEIAGHTSHFPWDEFFDVFDYNHDTDENNSGEYSKWFYMIKKEEPDNDDFDEINSFYATNRFLDEVKHIDDYLPLFSNGQYLISDYGLEPLFKLGEELEKQHDPNNILVIINKILDVTHQRSDLAELFIEGGSKSLDYISNS